MKNFTLLKTGIIGSILAAVCCFTPILVIFFSALGLSAAISYLDLVLFPVLAVFIGITLLALWKKGEI